MADPKRGTITTTNAANRGQDKHEQEQEWLVEIFVRRLALCGQGHN